MNSLFQYLPLFVEVARQKSLTKAAEALDMPLSTVSRRIMALESKLGVRLFHRTTRKIDLTDSGSLLYERCRVIVTDTETVFEDLADAQNNPRGDVRISMPPDIYFQYVSGALSAFAAKWPDIRLRVHLNPRWVDLYSEPYDIDLRAGPLPDSNLKVRKLTALHPRLYAAPSFLQKHPAPQSPTDLTALPCIVLAQHEHEAWPVSNGTQNESIFPMISHVVNSPSVALELVLAGIGISWFTPPMVKRHEKAGELVRVLREWRPYQGVNLNLVIAANTVPKRVRLLVEHLAGHFAAYAKESNAEGI